MTDTLIEFVRMLGPIAIIALLAAAFGTIRQILSSEAMTQTVLGILFGIVALLEMHAPIEPFDGLIIDLRNVPVALAGAFLGVRGLVICLMIAALSRAGIGGVGAISGIVGMSIAGFAGLLWARLRDKSHDCNWRMYALLSVMISSHLAAVVFLPNDIAIWFLSNAALPLLGVNLLCVPFVAALLDREARLFEMRLIIESATRAHVKQKFLSESDLAAELSLRRAANGPESVAGLIAIRLHYVSWIESTFGPTAVTTILGAIRLRLQAVFLNADAIGLTSDGDILLPLSFQEMYSASGDVGAIGHRLSDAMIDLGNNQPTRIKLSLKLTEIDPVDSLATLNFSRPEPARIKYTQDRDPKRTTRCVNQLQADVAVALQSSLFRKANLMMRVAPK